MPDVAHVEHEASCWWGSTPQRFRTACSSVVERSLDKREAVGANPTMRTVGVVAQSGEQLPYERKVGGASPPDTTDMAYVAI